MNAPAKLLLSRAAVDQLNWQPRRCTAPLKCIASRRGDVVELVLDVHQYGAPNAKQTRIAGPKHRYRLSVLTETTYLAERIDS